MKTVEIELSRIKGVLPDYANVNFIKYRGKSPAIEIDLFDGESLSEKDFELSRLAHKEIIGSENISEFFTEETGRHWYIFLKRENIIQISI